MERETTQFDARDTGLQMMLALIEQYANETDASRKGGIHNELKSGLATLFAHAIPDGVTSASALFEQCRESIAAVLPELAANADTPNATTDAVRAAMGAYSVLRNHSARQRHHTVDTLLRLKEVLWGRLQGIPPQAIFDRIDQEVDLLRQDPQHTSAAPTGSPLPSSPTTDVIDALHKPFEVRCHGASDYYLPISCSRVDGEAAMAIRTRDGTAYIGETQARLFFGFDLGALPCTFANTPVHMQWNPSWQTWTQVDSSMSTEPGVVTFGPLPASSNPSTLELDGLRFRWWFTATTPMRQTVVNELFYLDKQSTGVDYIDLMRQCIDNVKTNSPAQPAPQETRFAQLYWSPEHGQILVLLDTEDDGKPVVKVCAQPSNELCAYPLRFGEHLGKAQSAAIATFNSFNLEKAKAIADQIFALNG